MFLQVVFCCCSYTSGVQQIKGVFIWVSSGSGSSGSSSLFSEVFIAGVDEVGGGTPGNTTTVYVQALLEAFLNMSLRSAHFSDEACFW